MSARKTQARELSTQIIQDLADGAAQESLAFGRFDTQPTAAKFGNESLNTQGIGNFTESFACDEAGLKNLPTLPVPPLQQLQSLPTLPGSATKESTITSESTRDSIGAPAVASDPYLASLPQLPTQHSAKIGNELTTQIIEVHEESLVFNTISPRHTPLKRADRPGSVDDTAQKRYLQTLAQIPVSEEQSLEYLQNLPKLPELDVWTTHDDAPENVALDTHEADSALAKLRALPQLPAAHKSVVQVGSTPASAGHAGAIKSLNIRFSATSDGQMEVSETSPAKGSGLRSDGAVAQAVPARSVAQTASPAWQTKRKSTPLRSSTDTNFQPIISDVPASKRHKAEGPTHLRQKKLWQFMPAKK